MARSFKQRGTVVVPLAESPVPMVEVESTDNPASFSETVAGEGNITGLIVYGKSTQDGTPSPESPVPIVSAGDGGSIALTVSNGASLSQSMTISTPNGLPGIPVDSGGNYTDESGQQWVCDEIDYARKVYVQRVKQLSINDFAKNVSINPVTTGRRYAAIVPDRAELLNTQALSNYFPFNIVPGGSYSIEGDYISTDETKKVFIRIAAELTLDEFHQAYPDLVAYYQLETPIETPLSEEEIAAYKALHTYDGTTVISVNSDTITPGVKTTVKIIDPNSDNPQVMRLWLDEEGQPANINGRGARVGGAPTQQYILQPCSF